MKTKKFPFTLSGLSDYLDYMGEYNNGEYLSVLLQGKKMCKISSYIYRELCSMVKKKKNGNKFYTIVSEVSLVARSYGLSVSVYGVGYVVSV